jgi:hypothetical protein
MTNNAAPERGMILTDEMLKEEFVTEYFDRAEFDANMTGAKYARDFYESHIKELQSALDKCREENRELSIQYAFWINLHGYKVIGTTKEHQEQMFNQFLNEIKRPLPSAPTSDNSDKTTTT